MNTLRTGVRYRAGQVHRGWMNDAPIGDILPGIKVKRYQGEVIQMFLPNVRHAVDDPLQMAKY